MPLYTDKDGWTVEGYGKKIAWTAHQINLLQADVFGFSTFCARPR